MSKSRLGRFDCRSRRFDPFYTNFFRQDDNIMDYGIALNTYLKIYCLYFPFQLKVGLVRFNLASFNVIGLM